MTEWGGKLVQRCHIVEACSEPYQTSKMKDFVISGSLELKMVVSFLFAVEINEGRKTIH